MICRIEGIVYKTDEEYNIEVHVDSGLFYEVQTTSDLWVDLDEGSLHRFSCIVIYREESQKMYGFDSDREKEFFKLLMKTDGIGASMAITMLQEADQAFIVEAIINKDTNALSSLKGIGKKTAEKIIEKLKNKV